MTLELTKGTIQDFKSNDIRLFRVMSGAVWLTRIGDYHDYCYQEGTDILLPKGLWMITALTSVSIEWTHCDQPQAFARKDITPCFA